MESLAGKGSMIIMDRGKYMFNSCQGDGRYHVDIDAQEPKDFPSRENWIWEVDRDAAKTFLFQEDYLGSYAPDLQDIIRHSDGPFRPWLMYYVPTKYLNWSPSLGVTLTGDAAHVTTPFVGDGINCAMRDSIILVNKL